MSRNLRVTFSAEFKREAVCQLERGDKSVAQLARELGVRRNQLYKWKDEVEQHGGDAFPGHGGRQHKQDDTAKLRKDLKQLREENEILKKAAIYFARESK